MLSKGISIKKMDKNKRAEGSGTAKHSCVVCALLMHKACEKFHVVHSKLSLLSDTYHSLLYRPPILCLVIEMLHTFRIFFFAGRGIFSALKQNPL